MRKEKSDEITVRTVFAGSGSLEDILIELIQKKSRENVKNTIDSLGGMGYNESAVTPDIRAERGNC